MISIGADGDIHRILARTIEAEKNTALLVIDVQEEFCNPMFTRGNEETESVSKKIQKLAPAFREASIPVYAIWYGGTTRRTKKNPPVFYNFQPEEQDIKVKKLKPSVFDCFEASMDFRLKMAGIKNLLLCGFNRSSCVMFSALDAKNHGYNTYLLEDLSGDGKMDYQPSKNESVKCFVQNGIEVISADKLVDALKIRPK